MYDIKSIVTDKELVMTFKEAKESAHNDFKLLHAVQDDHVVGNVQLIGSTFEASSDEIFLQYKLWTTRPERSVGKKVDIAGKNMEELIEIYEELFIGACILSEKLTIEPGVKQPYEVALDWLRASDFYKAPASTQYHESFPGGLLVHSLNVYNRIIELLDVTSFASVDVAQAAVVALVHDWCKIGYYEPYQKNVKDEETGQWTKVTSYKVNQKGIPLGHGVTSLYLASKLLRLTIEQALAIRWHMGEYNVASNEVNELQKANSSYPMVYLIQFADRLACTEYIK